KAGVADAAVVLPPLNFQAASAGYVTLGVAANYVKDIPFTGMAVGRPWAAAPLDVAKRILTATDKSIAWLADPANPRAAPRSPGRGRPCQPQRCRGQLRLSARDRLFRAEQQSLACKAAQRDRGRATGRQHRAGAHDRTTRHARPHRAHRLSTGSSRSLGRRR